LRFNFSGPKSRLVNFSRRRKKETKPLLFISGSKIPEVSEIKHLGVYFDKGLRWSKQTDEVLLKTSKLKSLLKILANTKHGPSIESLVIIYKALVRSRIDYGIVVFGSPNQVRETKLETIQNSFMRCSILTQVPCNELRLALRRWERIIRPCVFLAMALLQLPLANG
jgi:hypothetical protein